MTYLKLILNLKLENEKINNPFLIYTLEDLKWDKL